MEITTKNKTQFYYNIVDIYVNWLVFLNKYTAMTEYSFFDLIPKLEDIRENLYLFIQNNSNINHESIKQQIRLLCEKQNIAILVDYINKFNNESIMYLALARLIKLEISKLYSHINDILKYNEEYPDKTNNFISYCLRDLITQDLQTAFNVGQNNESLLDMYISSLKLKYNKSGSDEAYVYITLLIMNNINSLLKESTVNSDNKFYNDLNEKIIDSSLNILSTFESSIEQLHDKISKNSKKYSYDKKMG